MLSSFFESFLPTVYADEQPAGAADAVEAKSDATEVAQDKEQEEQAEEPAEEEEEEEEEPEDVSTLSPFDLLGTRAAHGEPFVRDERIESDTIPRLSNPSGEFRRASCLVQTLADVLSAIERLRRTRRLGRWSDPDREPSVSPTTIMLVTVCLIPSLTLSPI